MAVIEKVIAKAQAADKKLVLPEGHDPRVITAANRIVREKIAEVIVLGTEAEIVESSAKGLGFDKEQFAADMAVLNMNSEVVSAALKRLDILTRNNDLTTSEVQLEQQRILKETAELNLTEARKKVAKSELLSENIEKDFKDYQIRLNIPEGQQRTWAQMAQEQQETGTFSPVLQGFMVSRSTLARPESHMATATFAAIKAGENNPSLTQQYKVMETLNDRSAKAAEAEWLKQKGYTAANLHDPAKLAEYQAFMSKFQIQNPDGSPNRARLAELDKMMEEGVEAANKDLTIATGDGYADLQGVSASVKAMNLEQKMLAAGADPAIVKVITDKIAAKIPLDFKAGVPAREELQTNIDTFLNTLGEEAIRSPNILETVDAVAKYQAKAYQLYRTHPMTKSRFPNWRESLIPGRPLSGEATINIEDAGSLNLMYREAIIKRRAKLFQMDQMLQMTNSPDNPAYLQGKRL
jgi:hypothetical protein